MSDEEPVRVMALHAYGYCKRLCYLEEIEEIRIADDRVYAGRTLHAEIEKEDDILIAPVCANCGQRIGERDTSPQRTWEGADPSYRIL